LITRFCPQIPKLPQKKEFAGQRRFFLNFNQAYATNQDSKQIKFPFKEIFLKIPERKI